MDFCDTRRAGQWPVDAKVKWHHGHVTTLFFFFEYIFIELHEHRVKPLVHKGSVQKRRLKSKPNTVERTEVRETERARGPRDNTSFVTDHKRMVGDRISSSRGIAATIVKYPRASS